MVLERRPAPDARWTAIGSIAGKPGGTTETLPKGVRQPEREWEAAIGADRPERERESASPASLLLGVNHTKLALRIEMK